MRRIALLALAMAALPAPLAAQAPGAAPAGAPMGVDFSWAGTEACGTRPPAFTVRSVPPGTAALDFRMTDLNVPSFAHGGGRVAYAGNGNIAAGAFAYVGPCPPGGTHQYQWTVTALNAAGAVLARATATHPFPPR